MLSAQLFKARGEAVAGMKAEGIEYEERMELLEDVTHPKPLAELLEAAYDIYRQGHPWVADYVLRPKSVVRDMYERAMSFVELVGFYQLARSEGVLLRYLADAYRTMRQSVPTSARTEELEDLMTGSASSCARSTPACSTSGSSCATGADEVVSRPQRLDEQPPPVTANPRAFRVLVRNAMFRRVELAARATGRRWASSTPTPAGTRAAWRDALGRTSTSTTRSAPGPTPAVRGCSSSTSEPAAGRCARSSTTRRATTTGGFTAEVDLAASDAAGEAVLHLTGVDQL